MKRYILFLLLTIIGAVTLNAQTLYEVSRDSQNGSKVLKGYVKKSDMISDTAFAWFAENQKNYTAYAKAVDALKKNKDVQILAFMGTWCDDSKFIIPKLFAVAEAAGLPENNLTLFGTDREKTSTGNLAEAFQLENVPTIIVMNKGKEIGRVVEFGKYGMFEIDLSQILNSISNTTTAQ
jgi:thiol-disulfide isomerase/thioredoxin